MTETSIITREQFIEAWCAVWEEKDKDLVLSKEFSGGDKWGTWTKCMLTSDDSFLKCVGKKIGIGCKYPKGRISQEDGGYYRLDMAFITDESDGYPALIDVAIEHENQRDVENEVWKLMHIRSPLKVIVFYGHRTFKSVSSKSGTICLEKKLDELMEMLSKANSIFCENENTEYLFVIGTVAAKNEKMQWRWRSNKQSSLRQLC